MIEYTRERLKKLIAIEFIRFCIVGGTGFIINLVILSLLHDVLRISIFLSQLVGAEIALFSNFLLHHHWTYKKHTVQKSYRNLLLQFHAASWPAIIGSSVMVTALVHLLHFTSLGALAVSSAVALVWNFVWSKFVIWRDVATHTVIKE